MWGALCTLHLYLVSESCIWAAICTLYPVSRIRIPYLGLILYPVSRISYPYQVFGANSLPCLMFRVSFILLFGSALYLASSILYFESCGLGRIPYPVSCIRIPYRRDINVIFSVSFILLLGSALYLALSILNFEKCGLDRIPYPVSRIRIPPLSPAAAPPNLSAVPCGLAQDDGQSCVLQVQPTCRPTPRR